MQKGIKFRIYPNKEQQNLINQTLGCCRLIYNKGLAMRNEAYESGNKIGYAQTSAMLTELKKCEDFAFLKVVDSIALQQSLRDLDRGFVNFFQKRAAHPTFKSKLNNVTIKCTPAGKYFAVLNVEFEPQPRANNGGCIGIDVGIKDFYSDSNGKVVPNPKYLEKSMRKLTREQRMLSRKQKGSNNRNKQRVKVALAHEKITNQRNDFLQKQSTMLIRENQTICIEDLKVKNMMRNHKLAQHIGSASWSKFFDMLKYKSAWYRNDLIKVPTMYPSSQICSCCGYKNPLVKNLAVRVWECPDCHTIHNRDTNASINILNKGLQMQSA